MYFIVFMIFLFFAIWSVINIKIREIVQMAKNTE